MAHDADVKLTLRQTEVLACLKGCGVMRTGCDGSVLESLRKKRLVIQHCNAAGGAAVYYTWTLSSDGKRLLQHPVNV